MKPRTIGAEDPASAPLVKYVQDIANELRAAPVRASTDFGNSRRRIVTRPEQDRRCQG